MLWARAFLVAHFGLWRHSFGSLDSLHTAHLSASLSYITIFNNQRNEKTAEYEKTICHRSIFRRCCWNLVAVLLAVEHDCRRHIRRTGTHVLAVCRLAGFSWHFVQCVASLNKLKIRPPSPAMLADQQAHRRYMPHERACCCVGWSGYIMLPNAPNIHRRHGCRRGKTQKAPALEKSGRGLYRSGW